jgi:hypothetical protein
MARIFVCRNTAIQHSQPDEFASLVKTASLGDICSCQLATYAAVKRTAVSKKSFKAI